MADASLGVAATVDLPRISGGGEARSIALIELFPGLAYHRLEVGTDTEIGRGPSSGVRLDHGTVSREHAVIRWAGGTATLADRGSRCGTFANGRRVGAQPVALEPGTVIRVGGVLLALRTGVEPFAARTHGIEAPDGLVGPVGLASVRREIDRIGHLDDSVLLLGDTGTGKELVAAAIAQRWRAHRGARATGGDRLYVCVNVAAPTSELFASELFGHARGAFTGAHRDHVGHIERANGGVLFLDEIGDLPERHQVALFRVLEDKRVRRVGDEKERDLDVRFIAATSRTCRTAVETGAMRADFYERIRQREIVIPRLRERPEDIPSLVAAFLSRARKKQIDVTAMDVAAIEALACHEWPGNVRGLENVLRKVTDLESDALPTADAVLTALSSEYQSGRSGGAVGPELDPVAASADARPAKSRERAEVTKETVRDALERSGGNRTAAAKRLGMARGTLYIHMQRLGMARAPRGA